MFRIRKTALVALALVAATVGLTRLTSASNGPAEPSLPFAHTSYVLGDDIDDYAAFLMSGGPVPDGIPSIDHPPVRRRRRRPPRSRGHGHRLSCSPCWRHST